MTGLVCKGKLWFSFTTWRNIYPLLSQIRTGYYTAKYLDPTINKDELEQSLEDTDPRLYRPIKSAKTEHRTSLTYHEDVEKFIRIMMKDGKKDVARLEVNKAFEKLKRIQLENYHTAKTDTEKNKIELNPQKIFLDALENCKPLLRITRVRRGGNLYEVPINCSPKFQTHKAIKFLIAASNEKHRSERFHDRLAQELLLAAKNEGKGFQKKLELHKRCEANKAYVTYKWS